MFVPYNRDIPFATDSPAQDQPDMQENTNSIDNILAIDHISFNLSNGGYHNVVHLTSQPPPATVPTIGEVYSTTTNDGITTSELFFFQNSAGNISQLTRNFTPINPAVNFGNGATVLAGGFILNYGTATQNTGGTVNFVRPFPFNVFSVVCTILENNNNRHFIQVKTANLTGFTVASRDSSGNDEANTFSWIAIGN